MMNFPRLKVKGSLIERLMGETEEKAAEPSQGET